MIFFLGLFVGVNLGLFIMSMISVARDADVRAEMLEEDKAKFYKLKCEQYIKEIEEIRKKIREYGYDI